MKYVMLKVEHDTTDQLVPIIFPDFMTHKDVAEYAAHILGMHHDMDAKPVSAGFLNLVTSNLKCYGESETIKLASAEGDAEVISQYNYFQGLVNKED